LGHGFLLLGAKKQQISQVVNFSLITKPAFQNALSVEMWMLSAIPPWCRVEILANLIYMFTGCDCFPEEGQ
jgi:hypothetical protein